ncbi:hypothetical protein UFOVP250_46 [uncultured Caudovirales phage]|uniref:Uncharacterized protein n=1 Tax=uncultured Caudovirales phage TaxID=2100421 RepID=A0A6J5LJ92_9CAUD|nr:hypothetical protein UFOVP250_46 [uncultured Caudovirales phage]
MADFNFSYSDHDAEEYTSSSFKSKSVDYICQKLEQFLLSAGYLMEGGHIALVRPPIETQYHYPEDIEFYDRVGYSDCAHSCEFCDSCGPYGSVEITTSGPNDLNNISYNVDVYSEFDKHQ